MSTLTVDLPDDLAARLESASQQRKVAPAEFVREVLERSLQKVGVGPAEASAYEAMRQGFGCFDSGLGDLSTNPRHLDDFGK